MPAFSFEDDLLDARVRVETTLGGTYEGAVFVAYKPAQYLVLETPAGAPAGKATYRTIKAAAIKSLTVLTAPPARDGASGTLPLPMKPEQLAARGNERRMAEMKKAMGEVQYLQVGASVRAQYIFDLLRKTMPCEWIDKESFRVLGEVTLTPPYSPEQCVGPNGPALVRVKKVLTAVLEKIG